MSTVAKALIVSAVGRLENLQAEIDERNDGKKQVYADAKGNGLEPWALRAIIAERKAAAKADPVKDAEREAVLDTYRIALGMIPADIDRAPAQVHAHEKTNSVRDSDAAAPPKGTSESLSLPAGGGKPEEAGNLSNSDGNNLPGGPAVSSAPTESASDEISASNTPEGRSGTAREAPSAGSGDDALQASSGIQSAAPFHSNAAPPPPVENAAHLPEGSEPSGLSSNRGQTNPVVPAKAEEAVPSTPQSQASSAATHTQPVRTKSGKGDRLPVPPPRHFPDLPSFLDRRKMAEKPEAVSEIR